MAKNDDEGPRSFSTLLGQLADGEAERDLSEQLLELTKKIQDEALARGDEAKGSLSLKIVITADHKGVATVTYTVDVKHPKRKTSAALYWLTKAGNLTPENPRQTKLPLRDVSSARVVRDAAADAPAVRDV